MNPLLPLNVTIPDGEPHVFNNRIYLYGSHDQPNGPRYCPNDYHVFSCDIHDLNHWMDEGVSYHKEQDIYNTDGKRDMYAPDCVQGNDGRYYLYYCLDGLDEVSVAVSASPAGPFEYYGSVKYPEGVNKLDYPDYPSSFDPSVMNDHGRIYLAWGFSVDFRIEGMVLNDANTKGAYIVELEEDMLTMKSFPTFVIPGYRDGKGTSFEGHEFLEASSLRKYGEYYYFIYSSQKQHELCYAMSKNVFGPYEYKGILISNAFESNKLMNNWANNHGGLAEVNGNYYIFYHRHTYGKQFSRQMCAEKIMMKEDGTFVQSAVSIEGMGNPLGFEEIEAGRAVYVHDNDEGIFLGFDPVSLNVARIEEDKIVNITHSTIVFRNFERVQKITLTLLGKSDGFVSLYMKNKLIDQKQISDCVVFDTDQTNTDITLVFESDVPVTLLKMSNHRRPE